MLTSRALGVGHSDHMARVLVRAQPDMRLRVELAPNGQGLQAESATIEWVGRVGHPSSYGLIGGALAETSGIALNEGRRSRFRGSLAGSLDKVYWGLEDEYRAAIEAALAEGGQPVLVSRAAHGEVGSSAYVFAALTRFLCHVLASDLSTSDEEVWRIFDSCWRG